MSHEIGAEVLPLDGERGRRFPRRRQIPMDQAIVARGAVSAEVPANSAPVPAGAEVPTQPVQRKAIVEPETQPTSGVRRYGLPLADRIEVKALLEKAGVEPIRVPEIPAPVVFEKVMTHARPSVVEVNPVMIGAPVSEQSKIQDQSEKSLHRTTEEWVREIGKWGGKEVAIKEMTELIGGDQPAIKTMIEVLVYAPTLFAEIYDRQLRYREESERNHHPVLEKTLMRGYVGEDGKMVEEIKEENMLEFQLAKAVIYMNYMFTEGSENLPLNIEARSEMKKNFLEIITKSNPSQREREIRVVLSGIADKLGIRQKYVAWWKSKMAVK